MEHSTNVWFIASAWMLLAFLASIISIRSGTSVALVEIAMGVLPQRESPCTTLLPRWIEA